jgi:hypothetical protein
MVLRNGMLIREQNYFYAANAIPTLFISLKTGLLLEKSTESIL